MIDDIQRLGPMQFMWEENKHNEKHTQAAKNEFVSKKGNVGEMLIKRCM